MRKFFGNLALISVFVAWIGSMLVGGYFVLNSFIPLSWKDQPDPAKGWIALGITLVILIVGLAIIMLEDDGLLEPGIYLVDIKTQTSLRYDPALKMMMPKTSEENTFTKIGEAKEAYKLHQP